MFITHEHSDHCIGLPALLRQNPLLKVFANRETARRIKDSLKSQPDWQLFETGTTFEFRGMQVTSIPIPHDAADPVGFAFDLPAEDARPAKRLTWLTDLGHATPVVKHHVSLADILVLEANYDDEMLDGRGHERLLRRVVVELRAAVVAIALLAVCTETGPGPAGPTARTT